MPSTRDIRRRIKSVKNTAQITKAMQMVASSKMRKAQLAALAGRPYAALINNMLAHVAGVAGDVREHVVDQRRVRPSRQGSELRLAHLRRSDHLHGLRDLRRVLDRLDAPAYVACAGHWKMALPI